MKLTSWILSIFISIGALFPGMDYGQLVKMIKLVKHYELHQQETQALGSPDSFLDFLEIHLFDSDTHSHEEGEDPHQQLPFQQLSSVSSFCFIPVNYLSIVPTHASNQASFILKNLSGSLFKNQLLQPPMRISA